MGNNVRPESLLTPILTRTSASFQRRFDNERHELSDEFPGRLRRLLRAGLHGPGTAQGYR